jgi:ubiquinol-cytochrome c reductase cytochrome b subunit
VASSGRREGQVAERIVARLRERERLDAALDGLRRRVFPDHWALLFGQVAVYSFVVVTVTGVVLSFFYDPSSARVDYDGSYAPLQGVEMSRALESTLDISFELRGGLLVRQLHNWSASLMIASLLLHILRIFFTGGFRKPRELTWIVLFLILFATLAAGLTGTFLPDDLLSGSSLAVLDGALKAIPFVGTWLSHLLFQGRFPSGAIATFYPLHVYVLPAVTAVLMIVNAVIALVHRPAQFPGPGRTEDNVVGRPLPVAAVKSAGLFGVVLGVLIALAATATVNPVWSYGPADPANASAGAAPPWYLAFVDGAQRLTPPGWEFVWLGRTWTLAILVPLAAVTLYLLVAMAYPFVEAWITGDRRRHHLLDRPRNAPTRTAIGVAGASFYGVLWAAAGADIAATHLGLSVDDVITTLRLALVLGPPAAFTVTKRVCLGLQRKDRELVLHGRETGRLVRTHDGGYVELVRPVDTYERWRLVAYEAYEPTGVRPDGRGHGRLRDRARAAVSRWYFEDRVLPVTPRDLDEPALPPATEGRPAIGETRRAVQDHR